MPFVVTWHGFTAPFINICMQDKRKEGERQQEQPGSMASYNNREDNRQGRVEETDENDNVMNKEERSHPGAKPTQNKEDKKA